MSIQVHPIYQYSVLASSMFYTSCMLYPECYNEYIFLTTRFVFITSFCFPSLPRGFLLFGSLISFIEAIIGKGNIEKKEYSCNDFQYKKTNHDC